MTIGNDIGALGLTRSLRPRIMRSAAIGVAITACYIAQGMLFAWALADLFAGASVLPASLAALAGVIVLRAGLLWVAEMAAQDIAAVAKQELRQRLLSHLAAFGPGVTLLRQTGDLQATIVGGVEALETYCSRYLPAIASAILGCAGVLILLAVVDWPSALVLSVFVIAFPLLDRLWMRWCMPEISGVFSAMGAFGTYLLDSLQGVLTLKAFGASERRRAVLARRAATLRQESMRTLAVTMMRTGLTSFVTLSGIAFVLSFNAWRAASGTLSPFALLIALFLAREAFRPLDRLEKEFHTAWAASGAIAPIADLLALKPPIADPAAPIAPPVTSDIIFDDVGFTYGGRDAPALSSVSFAVHEREFVAIVGPSGAGKSTVAALLMRFFDPQEGVIRIGGANIRDLRVRDIRAMVSVVSQDTFLFHGTIADNLRLAKPEASLEELRAASAAAHIATFIENLPRGFDTIIGERGAQLSGGQRQRLAIARALLKNAPILVLDEATSNLDPASERAIQAALDTMAAQRTTLVIAHRLSTVVKADRVLVFDGGRLVEAGSPVELANSDGAYARLIAAEKAAA